MINRILSTEMEASLRGRQIFTFQAQDLSLGVLGAATIQGHLGAREWELGSRLVASMLGGFRVPRRYKISVLFACLFPDHFCL